MNNQMENKRSRIWVVVIGLIVLAGVLAGIWAYYTFENTTIISVEPFNPFNPRPRPEFNPADLEFYYIARTVFSTINIGLLAILTAAYAMLYAKTRSQFTIGLLIFAAVFLMKEITSSPFVIGVFRFSISGLGPFALIEPLFETAALSVLLYLSIEY
jgi:hypothetical protein